MNIPFSFRPKLVDTLKNYSAQKFSADLTAGITVGIVALPLAMALAIASGVKPEIGHFHGDHRRLSGFGARRLARADRRAGGRVRAAARADRGDDGAGRPAYGADGLVVCALMAGVILFVLGACKLGTMIKYIPFPVVTGFTSGIAIIIMSTQIHDFFGLNQQLPADFIGKVSVPGGKFSTELADGSAGDALRRWRSGSGRKNWAGVCRVPLWSFCWRRWRRYFFSSTKNSGLQTLGSAFGEMPRSLPLPHWPSLSFDDWRALLPAAMTVAVLGAIESLLCAVVADGMIDDRHDSNQELMAQGIANMVVGIFGGMPTTGVIARTATNVRSGAQTPVAGIIHSLTLLVILLLAAPLAKNIPLAALSAVLVVVSLRMGEWHQFVRLKRWPKSDVMVFLCAFGLTVAVDLPTAVGASLILASALLVKRLSETTHVSAGRGRDAGRIRRGRQTAGKKIPEGVMVFRDFRRVLFWGGGQIGIVVARARAIAGGFDFADARRAGAGCDRAWTRWRTCLKNCRSTKSI